MENISCLIFCFLKILPQSLLSNILSIYFTYAEGTHKKLFNPLAHLKFFEWIKLKEPADDYSKLWKNRIPFLNLEENLVTKVICYSCIKLSIYGVMGYKEKSLMNANNIGFISG